MKKTILGLLGAFTLLGGSLSEFETQKPFGVIDDSYNVTPLGSYNHIIPIQVTPGVNGLQPNLSFVYDSNAGASEIGIGWSLAGLSKITRAGNNYAQNGRNKGITFTNNDNFLLDGQYLTAVRKKNGESKSQYRTENESFNKIYASGNIIGSSSPEHFIVKKPNGQTYTYGKLPEHRISLKIEDRKEVLIWHLNKIEDTNGNYIDFNYSQLNNIARIENIIYFNNKNIEIGSVLFEYSKNTESINQKVSTVSLIRGNIISANNILTSVVSEVFGNDKKYYHLKYDHNYSKLLKVFESTDEENKNALEPTEISYNEIDTLDFSIENKIKIPYLNKTNKIWKQIDFDIENDGIDESLVFKVIQDSLKVLVYKSKNNVFEIQDTIFIEKGYKNALTELRNINFSDFNGDSNLDLITKNGIYLYNPNQSFPFDFNKIIYPKKNTSINQIIGTNGILLSVNLEEGLNDQLILFNKTTKKHFVYRFVNSKNEFEEVYSFEVPCFKAKPIIKENGTNSIAISVNTNELNFSFLKYVNGKYEHNKIFFGSIPVLSGQGSYTDIIFDDINLDGNQDILRRYDNSNKLQVILSDNEYPNYYNIDIPKCDQTKIRFGNFLNSGYKEIFIPLNSSEFKIYALKSSLTRVSGRNVIRIDTVEQNNKRFKISGKIKNLIKDEYFFSDINGDGISDLTVIFPNDDYSKSYKTQYLNKVNYVNRIKSIKDGFGNIVKIEYDNTINKDSYNFSNSILKNKDYSYVFNPFTIVKKTFYSNGLTKDSLNSKSYRYGDLITHLKGRGISGFRTFEVIDNQNLSSTTKEYEYLFPLSGRIIKEIRKDNEGNIFFKQKNKWNYKTFSRTEKSFIEITDNEGIKIGKNNYSELSLIPKFNTTGIRYLGFLEKTKIENFEKNDEDTYVKVSGSEIDFKYNSFGNIEYQTTKLLDGTTIIKESAYENFNKRNTPSSIYLLGLISEEKNYIKNKNGNLSRPRQFNFVYDKKGRLKRKIRERDYKNWAQVSEVQDISHITEYDYDTFGNISQKSIINNDSDIIEKYTYDDDGRFLKTIENQLGYTTTYDYDDFYGQITKETDLNLNITINEYDKFGNLKKMILPTGEIKTIAYSKDIYLANKIGLTNASYQIISNSNIESPVQAFFDIKGREIGSITRTIDLNEYSSYMKQKTSHIGLNSYEKVSIKGRIERKVVSKIEYDNRSNIKRVNKPQYYHFTYNENGSLDCVKSQSDITTEYKYDQFNRLVKTQFPDGNVIKTNYTAKKKVNIIPKGSGKEIYEARNTTFYNDKGEITKIQNHKGEIISYVYDSWGNLTNTITDKNSIITEYDHLGRKTRILDDNLGTVDYQYDQLDRIIKEISNKDSLNSREVTITYDELSRINTKKTPEKVFTWFYDNLNRKGTISKIESREQSSGLLFSEETFTYNKLGNVTESKIILEKPFISKFEYDKFNRIKIKTFPGDDNPYRISYSYINNIVTKISDYHNENNKEVWKPIFEIKETDALGKVIKQKYGNGIKTSFKYNKFNDQLENIKSGVIQYKPKLLFGCAPRINSLNIIDQFNELTTSSNSEQSFNHKNSNNSSDYPETPLKYENLQDLEFTYDINYNLISKTDNRLQNENTYSYDPLNRLKSYEEKGNDKVNLEYRSDGSIRLKSDVGTYAYNSKQRVTSIRGKSGDVFQFQYDGFGNIEKEIRSNGDTINIIYNSFNKPISIANKSDTIYTYSYGSSNRELVSEIKLTGKSKPIRKSIKPYSDFEIVEENEKKTIIHYILLNGNLVASHNVVQSPNSTLKSNQYYHKDHLGSITLITDSNAIPIARYSYDAYGKQEKIKLNRNDNSINFSLVTLKGYTGHEHLNTLGYINAKGRFYHPSIGRFMSPDPFVQAPLNLQSTNRYSYVMNNPLNLVDPSGFGWKPFRDIGRAFKKAGNALKNVTRGLVEFHNNIYKETGRFVKKYGKQLVVIAVAAAITYFSAGVASGWAAGFASSAFSSLGTAMLTGAAWGAGISAGITAIKGGSLKDVLNAGFNGAIAGATAAAAAYSIGSGFDASGLSTKFGDSGYFAKSIAHGTSGGIQAEINGGEFKNGFLSASMSYSFTPLNEKIFGVNPDNSLQRIAFSSTLGATTSYATGGNIMEGAITAGFIRAYNCEQKLLRKFLFNKLSSSIKSYSMGEMIDNKNYFGATMKGVGMIGDGLSLACVAGPNPVCITGKVMSYSSTAYTIGSTVYGNIVPQSQPYQMNSSISEDLFRSNIPELKMPNKGPTISPSRY